MRVRSLVALLLGLIAPSLCAQSPEIISYDADGVISFSSSTPTINLFSLEFAPDISGPWTNWGSISSHPITGSVMSLPTPMFFRIRESTGGVIEDPYLSARLMAKGLDHNRDVLISAEEASLLKNLTIEHEYW